MISSGPVVEPATLADHPAIARLTVDTYAAEGFGTPEYAVQLADVAGRATWSEVLVARTTSGSVVGAVALVLDPDFCQVTRSADEAEFRMLVVDPAGRGSGTGTALVRACLGRSRAAGRRRVVLSTEPTMTTAHRLYERLGFTRLPDRDWSPEPGVTLRVYGVTL